MERLNNTFIISSKLKIYRLNNIILRHIFRYENKEVNINYVQPLNEKIPC